MLAGRTRCYPSAPVSLSIVINPARVSFERSEKLTSLQGEGHPGFSQVDPQKIKTRRGGTKSNCLKKEAGVVLINARVFKQK